jgi:hypothetical protein
MKDIDKMTLAECLDALRMETLLLDENWSFATFSHQDRIQLADRINELTRWIPVSERMPTREDADENGEVLVSETENESPHRKFSYMKKWNRINDPNYFYTIRRWRRITPPEDKP